jgi:MOSC domain-containing protein YiiM
VTVTNLFIKRAHRERLDVVSRLAFTPNGISGGVRCSPLRQVLITSRAMNRDLGLEAGDLRENIVVELDGLYDLPSGSVIRVGDALIRLTFHCEPCRRILHLVAFDDAVHKRGFLGSFLNRGTIAVGDAVAVTDDQHEPIPYAVKDRIRWFLGRQEPGLAARDLAHALGLPAVYARALPRMVEKLAVTRRPSE